MPARRRSTALLSVLLLAATGALATGSPSMPLTPQKPVTIPGGPGGFDWMAVDTGMHRLYAAHKGTGTLAVLDLATGKLISSPKTGAAQGIAIDEKDNKLFIGDDTEQKVVVLDRRTLKVLAEIKVAGPVDAIGFDPKNGKAYACHDDGTEAWVIDAKTNKLAGTVALGGIPEFIEYDAKSDRLYQNLKDTNQVAVIDPATNTVVAKWPSAPATGPHGLAIDREARRLYTAGSGVVVTLDLATGKPVGSAAPIAPGYVDQIAFDAKRHLLYCAVSGAITVLKSTQAGIEKVADVPQPKGAHTLAVDSVTGTVWISYADKSASYLRPFTLAK